MLDIQMAFFVNKSLLPILLSHDLSQTFQGKTFALLDMSYIMCFHIFSGFTNKTYIILKGKREKIWDLTA